MGGCVVPANKGYPSSALKYQLPNRPLSPNPLNPQSQTQKRKSPLINNIHYQSQQSLNFQPYSNTQYTSRKRTPSVPALSPRNQPRNPLTQSIIPVLPDLKSKIPQVLISDQTQAISQNQNLMNCETKDNPEAIPMQQIRLNNHLITPIPPVHNLLYLENRNQQLRRNNSSQSPIVSPRGGNGNVSNQNRRMSQKPFSMNTGGVVNSPGIPTKLNSMEHGRVVLQKNY